MGAVATLSALSLFESSGGMQSALGQERETKGRVCVGPEVVQRTLNAMCKVLVPSELGSIPGEKDAPKTGTGVLIRTPAALSELVGDDKMVVLSVAHNFMDTPPDADITLEFFSGRITGVSRTESLRARVLASDRRFNGTDDVAFLLVDLPRDPPRAEGLRSRALDIEENFSFGQFSPVASVGFSDAKCTMFDDLRLLDAPKQRSGNAAVLLTGFVKPGHSGSPLVNSAGHVIGVVSGAEVMPRSIAEGSQADFIPTWKPIDVGSASKNEAELAIRRHDLKHIPHEVQISKERIVGPSAQAISAFANTVKEAYTAALSTFDPLEMDSRRLVTKVRRSDLSPEDQARLVSFVRERLATKAATIFALVGGTPPSITERIKQFGE
jgi:hypothetical protein